MVENSLIVLEFITSTILENIILLLPLTLLFVLHTRNNTDSNKLVIFFSIALYCSDNSCIYDYRLVVRINKTKKNKKKHRQLLLLLYIRRPMKTTITKRLNL